MKNSDVKPNNLRAIPLNAVRFYDHIMFFSYLAPFVTIRSDLQNLYTLIVDFRTHALTCIG